MAPFAFISDGLEEDTYVEKETGDVWKVDEYGQKGGGIDYDNSFMWNYK